MPKSASRRAAGNSSFKTGKTSGKAFFSNESATCPKHLSSDGCRSVLSEIKQRHQKFVNRQHFRRTTIIFDITTLAVFLIWQSGFSVLLWNRQDFDNHLCQNIRRKSKQLLNTVIRKHFQVIKFYNLLKFSMNLILQQTLSEHLMVRAFFNRYRTWLAT